MGEDVAVDHIEVVVAHAERTTLRVGDMFVKVDVDQARLEAEAQAMAATPIPTAQILWQHPSVLALGALPGRPLGRLGDPVSSSPAAWAAAGAVIRAMHEAPLPTRTGRTPPDASSTFSERRHSPGQPELWRDPTAARVSGRPAHL